MCVCVCVFVRVWSGGAYCTLRSHVVLGLCFFLMRYYLYLKEFLYIVLCFYVVVLGLAVRNGPHASILEY